METALFLDTMANAPLQRYLLNFRPASLREAPEESRNYPQRKGAPRTWRVQTNRSRTQGPQTREDPLNRCLRLIHAMARRQRSRTKTEESGNEDGRWPTQGQMGTGLLLPRAGHGGKGSRAPSRGRLGRQRLNRRSLNCTTSSRD